MTCRLSPIDESLTNIINRCTSNIKEKENKARITSYMPLLIANEKLFRENMINQSQMVFQEYCLSGVDYDKMKIDMISLYSNKFSKKGQPGRDYYNSIKLLTGHCPYCQHNQVKQVDHYLPKTEAPTLAVTPINLVPACTDCNEAKSTNTGFFHPYFDDVDSMQYLFCKVLFKDKDIIFKFYSQKPENWEIGFYEKIESLFTKMNEGHDILELFRIEARIQFNMLKRNLIRSANRDMKDLNDTLNDYLESAVEEIGLNSWQAALYNGLLNEVDSLYNFLTIKI